MGSIKSNIVPLAVGAAIGYFAIPYLVNLVKNR